MDERVREYLRRIEYSGSIEPTLDVLYALQYAHLHNIPYENLDIMQGKPIVLDIDLLYDKIVLRRRGGYCFELNYLFGWFLRQLGFSVCDHFGRFLMDSSSLPKRRHWVLRVTIDGTNYLSDVGVGVGQPRWPLLLKEELEQSRGGESWRVRRDDFLGWVVDSFHAVHGWREYISFSDDVPLVPDDFVAISYFCEHSDQSPFNKKNIVAIRTQNGRNTLDGDEFRIFYEDKVETFIAQNAEQFNEKLQELFELSL